MLMGLVRLPHKDMKPFPRWAVKKTNALLPESGLSHRSAAARFVCHTVPQRQHEEAEEPRGRRRTNASNTDRDLLLSVLSASTTKRDAKSYLSRFRPAHATSGDATRSTQFASGVALVLVRAMQSWGEGVEEGVIQTLAHFVRLGLHIVLVPDHCTEDIPDAATSFADRLVSSLEKDGNTRARRLDYALGITADATSRNSVARFQGAVKVEHSQILLNTVKNGIIPVIPPIAHMTNTQRRIEVSPEEVLFALTRAFIGASSDAESKAARHHDGDSSGFDDSGFSVDRIIVLDPLGGLSSFTRPDHAHIFVNLEQEYAEIKDELSVRLDQLREESKGGSHATLASSDSASKLVESGIDISSSSAGEDGQDMATRRPRYSEAIDKSSFVHLIRMGYSSNDPNEQSFVARRQLQNLEVMQQCLSLLPPSSSALLTAPSEAATMPPSKRLSSEDLGVITRRPKNPLVFSLLTNKPTISSSLPTSRRRIGAGPFALSSHPSPATFFKRGMAVTLIPDPRRETWVAPTASVNCMSLDDPRIDFGRLLNLIEDSFNRPLDIGHYLNRIRNKVAGVIVAGDYEGGAILTWELPPSVPDDGSTESASRMVPYLDKFAVLKRSQGAGGVADIVFSAMVRTCFPNGVCWRSRKNNPVNKWYFERSVGSWKLPKSDWSMFWTTPGLMDDEQRLSDYEAVCRAIQPSWADKKHIVD